jgi:3-oxosteroid 1-dehydrogenase
LECDFLCVGGGLGGLAGAIAAHDAGLDVLVLEKSGLLGGVAAYSGGVVWVPDNHLQADAGYPDTLDAAAAYLDWLTPKGIDVDQPLRTAYLQQARHVFEYFTEQVGIPFEVVPGPDQYYPDAADTLNPPWDASDVVALWSRRNRHRDQERGLA